MNDFTKEELNHLLKIMDHVYLDNYGQELGIKIQSMIDNYCEHENHDVRISKHWICEVCKHHVGYITSEELKNDNQ